jgi:uncharacterized membrane protein YhhN
VVAAPLLWVAAAGAVVYTAISMAGVSGPVRALKLVTPLALAWGTRDTPLACGAFVLSAVGDALLLDKYRFMLAGLGAFLLAHLAFIPALWAGAPPAWTAAYGALVLGVVYALRSRLKGPMRAAVPVYATVLATMAAVAAGRGALGALGGALFLLSDALLAVHVFVRPLPGRDGAVLVTYYGALMLLAAGLAG